MRAKEFIYENNSNQSTNFITLIKNIFVNAKKLPGFVDAYTKVMADKEDIKKKVNQIMMSDKSEDTIRKILFAGKNFSINETIEKNIDDKAKRWTLKIVEWINLLIMNIASYALFFGGKGELIAGLDFGDRALALSPFFIGTSLVVILINWLEKNMQGTSKK